MSRILDRPCEVMLGNFGPAGGYRHPVRFKWRGLWRDVREIMDAWVEAGAWWEGEGQKWFFRVLTEDEAAYELYYDQKERRWAVYRVFD